LVGQAAIRPLAFFANGLAIGSGRAASFLRIARDVQKPDGCAGYFTNYPIE
jgi:hypothetical protein